MQLVFTLLQKQWENMIDIWQMKRLKNVRAKKLMEDEDCISQMFEQLRTYKGEPKWIKVKSKRVSDENELKLIVLNASGFDSLVILNNLLPSWCRTINQIKTARRLITVKVFNGFCDVKENYKGKPHYINLICSLNHLEVSLGKLGKTFGLPKKLSKKWIMKTYLKVLGKIWQMTGYCIEKMMYCF